MTSWCAQEESAPSYRWTSTELLILWSQLKWDFVGRCLFSMCLSDGPGSPRGSALGSTPANVALLTIFDYAFLLGIIMISQSWSHFLRNPRCYIWPGVDSWPPRHSRSYHCGVQTQAALIHPNLTVQSFFCFTSEADLMLLSPTATVFTMQTHFPSLFQTWRYSEFDTGHVNDIDIPN